MHVSENETKRRMTARVCCLDAPWCTVVGEVGIRGSADSLGTQESKRLVEEKLRSALAAMDAAGVPAAQYDLLRAKAAAAADNALAREQARGMRSATDTQSSACELCAVNAVRCGADRALRAAAETVRWAMEETVR